MHCGSDCRALVEKLELTICQWQEVLTQLADMKVEKVVFSGGEPTLKKGFESLLLTAAGLGLKVGFISNGLQPFSDLLQEAITQSQPFAVGLSIDGLKNVHNKIRRNENSWQGLMKNIFVLQRLAVPICAVTTLHKLNYQELTRLGAFFDLAEVDSWQIQLAMPFGRMKTRRELLLGEQEFREVCRQVAVLRKQFSQISIQAADCFGAASPDIIRSGCWNGCSAGISSLGIDASGNVMPCLSLQGGIRGENVQSKPLSEIWKSSSIFDFNRQFDPGSVKGNCAGCNYLNQCRGGCNSQSFAYYGYLHSSPFCFVRSFQS
jgi:MoaA/NifB/PqqE/SkfB family radical SAM enzyme